MSDKNPEGVVGTVKTADLEKIWGPEITIKRSHRDGKRYPLYLAPNTGAIFLNSQRGQDGLLDHGHFYGAEGPPVAPVGEPKQLIPEGDIPNREKPQKSALSRLLDIEI